jgi:hypothetical protein
MSRLDRRASLRPTVLHIPLTEYSLEAIFSMTWDVEYTDAFQAWFEGLREAERESVDAAVDLLEEFGPNLRFPLSSKITQSRLGNLRELRIQHRGRPYRVLYAFDTQRVAVLLLGGDKIGHDRWYEQNVPRAEILYRMHLMQLARGETRDGKKV